MASASRATARMSSAVGLAAMRYSGSCRANAFFAGSSEGNGLSVMAMMVRGMKFTPYDSLSPLAGRGWGEGASWLDAPLRRRSDLRRSPPHSHSLRSLDLSPHAGRGDDQR